MTDRAQTPSAESAPSAPPAGEAFDPRDAFERALELEESERERFLNTLRTVEPALAARVEALLRAHEGGRSPLDAPLEFDPAELGEESAPVHLEGRCVRGFEVVREVGSGGMGTVYEALQDRPRRRVAFKVLARDGSSSLGERLALEAEALARLDHPAIASVLGAGDDEVGGRPLAWMAVEFVDDALPIHTYAESVGLGVHARVRLLRDVARAVEHAHAKGVLHRDLKPQNLLVASETGAPKVIDFGLARITERLGHADARRTRKGELLGTLAYMSPEQAAGDNERVDVRTDVYALGVVLYELLAGALPHELADLTLFDALKEVQRGILRGPRSVDPSLDADLDGIVRTAGAAEPSARYATAGALADDLDRWLDGRPVLARPPSSLHRLRLFARRRRPLFLGLVAGGALGAAGLTAIVSLSVENAARLREIGEQEEKVASARAELDEVGEIVGAIVARDARNILDAAGAESGTDEEKREAVRAALDELDRLRPLLDRDPESVPVLARTYGQLGDMRWTGWNMDAEDAETLWRAGVRSTELWRSALANAPESQEYERQMHASLIRVANAARRSSRTEEGLAYADECVSLARRMLARSPEDTAANDALIESLFARGDLFIPRRSAPQGLADGLESLALAEALKGDTPERRVKRFQTIAWAQLRLGFWILRERSDARGGAEGHAAARRAWAESLHVDGADAPDPELLWTIFLGNEIAAFQSIGEAAAARDALDASLRDLAPADGTDAGDAGLVFATKFLVSSVDGVEDPVRRQRWEAALIEAWSASEPGGVRALVAPDGALAGEMAERPFASALVARLAGTLPDAGDDVR